MPTSIAVSVRLQSLTVAADVVVLSKPQGILCDVSRPKLLLSFLSKNLRCLRYLPKDDHFQHLRSMRSIRARVILGLFRSDVIVNAFLHFFLKRGRRIWCHLNQSSWKDSGIVQRTQMLNILDSYVPMQCRLLHLRSIIVLWPYGPMTAIPAEFRSAVCYVYTRTACNHHWSCLHVLSLVFSIMPCNSRGKLRSSVIDYPFTNSLPYRRSSTQIHIHCVRPPANAGLPFEVLYPQTWCLLLPFFINWTDDGRQIWSYKDSGD